MTKLTRATSKFWVAGGSSAAQQELMLGLDDDDGWLQVDVKEREAAGGRGSMGEREAAGGRSSMGVGLSVFNCGTAHAPGS